ncbi:MAG: hypothetical protein NTX55_01930 [Candidatus Parcubacteria bacterium]|nr:hypothetical protein [Candidatus Parcubacteria bacterium]
MSEIEKIKKLIQLDKKNEKAAKTSATEREVIENEQRFEAVYYSNKLEGNKLSKTEARRAVLTR